MRLAEFILQEMEEILARWEAFAATRLPAAGRLAPLELRDHAQQILEAVVRDLGSAQTREAQAAKSMGLAPVAADAPETAAQTHAVLRARSGFDIRQLTSEYRALRASVLSLWLDACPPEPPSIDDLIRFNEAIDQALAESIEFFSAHVTRSRNLLLGMLSHDLRSPLQTIQTTAHFLRALDTTAEVGQAAGRLISSGARMHRLLDDLVDFNRTELGLGIPVTPAEVDLGAACGEEVDQIRGAYAGCCLQLSVEGECRGSWDAGRIQQLLNNLIVNALRYGESGGCVRIDVRGDAAGVQIAVSNTGTTIPPDVLGTLFEPLRRGPQTVRSNDSGLGLGLYIANEIARAHGGTISARSERGNTVFTATLPRVPGRLATR